MTWTLWIQIAGLLLLLTFCVGTVVELIKK